MNLFTMFGVTCSFLIWSSTIFSEHSSPYLCSFQSKLQKIADERQKKVQEQQEREAMAETGPGSKKWKK